eukprot:c19746_g2_i1.p1 GENE.c19746_g2_i1~~c19746_g2_i1.p1  ORF type:complete len:500 (+),score=109.17 c19746_g2_i1:35-1534(+)
MVSSIKVVIFLVLFVLDVLTSYLQIDNANTNVSKIIKVDSPAFDLGNKDFPVSGVPLFVRGCSGIKKISDENVMKISNTSKFISFVEFDANDNDCVRLSLVLDCQKRFWCAGVFSQDVVTDPAGASMWSIFDEKRPRSAYKVPMVQSNEIDFVLLKTTFYSDSQSNMTIVLTLDPNPWETMFRSVPFILFFRVLSPIWSFGCVILASSLLRTALGRANQRTQRGVRSSTSEESFSQHHHHESFQIKQIKSSIGGIFDKFTVITVCLSLKIFTNFVRIIYFAIDPLFSFQVLPLLYSYILVTLTTTFEVVTNVLLAFVIHEITKMTPKRNLLQQLKGSIIFILIFVLLDMFTAVMAGLTKNFGLQSWMVKVIFYVVMNIVLGLWYIWQGTRFLKSSLRREKRVGKANRQRRTLTRISMVSSGGMILVGVFVTFLSMKSIAGTPWGYLITWTLIFIVIQITSFCQVLLFGGLPLDLKMLAFHVRKSLVLVKRENSKSDFTL